MSRATVPADWGPEKVENVALKLYDAVFLLGPRIRFEEWWGKFKPGAKEDTARRGWERTKSEWRAASVAFELEDEFAGEPLHSARTVVFESVAYAMGMVDALIGPPNPEDGLDSGTQTLTVFDLFPKDTHADVEWLINTMASELTQEDNA